MQEGGRTATKLRVETSSSEKETSSILSDIIIEDEEAIVFCVIVVLQKVTIETSCALARITPPVIEGRTASMAKIPIPFLSSL